MSIKNTKIVETPEAIRSMCIKNAINDKILRRTDYPNMDFQTPFNRDLKNCEIQYHLNMIQEIIAAKNI